jgi:hypothetical protein
LCAILAFNPLGCFATASPSLTSNWITIVVGNWIFDSTYNLGATLRAIEHILCSQAILCAQCFDLANSVSKFSLTGLSDLSLEKFALLDQFCECRYREFHFIGHKVKINKRFYFATLNKLNLSLGNSVFYFNEVSYRPNQSAVRQVPF